MEEEDTAIPECTFDGHPSQTRDRGEYCSESVYGVAKLEEEELSLSLYLFPPSPVLYLPSLPIHLQ